MREVQIYVDNQRIDLFNDEEIQVTSSIQNIQDIAKVFTDFTQTFTVPASPVNNAIFDHYYNNDNDGAFKAKVRASARIEINFTPFRRGKIQLEGANIKDGQAESYKITFYGDVVTLKDLFGDDKLSDLDYSTLQVEFNGANVQTAIESTSAQNVMYPLISSSKVWTYADAGANDISLVGNPIEYNELFPAIKDSKIFDLIESKYGVTFQGNFLTDARFASSYTWWKNRETPDFTSEPYPLTFNSGAASCSEADIAGFVGTNQVNISYLPISDITTPADWSSWTGSSGYHHIRIHIFNTSTSNTWYIDTYKNGTLNGTVTGSGDVSNNLALDYLYNTNGLTGDTWTFELRSDGALTFDYTVQYYFNIAYINTSSSVDTLTLSCSFSESSASVTNYLDFNTSAPDIKIEDWFSGILKQFNLTCYPLDTVLNFQIEPLDQWYNFGDAHDITPYVDVKEIKIDRPKLYEEITFAWQDSKSFMNENFLETNNRQYGALKETFPLYDGGKYEVKLPFENLLFNKFTNQNLQVGYSLTKAPDYKPYIPKPVKLYIYENQTTDVSFYFDNDTTVDEITNYMPFGTDCKSNLQDHSMNFGEEVSSLLLNPNPNSLYKSFYFPYLANLFNDKTRIVTVECILPLSILTKLTLDDAIFIRDKKYRINDMTVNLTSGKCNLVLISDWVSTRRRVVAGEQPVPQIGGCINVPIKPPKGGWVIVTGTAETGVTITPTLPSDPITEQGYVRICWVTNSTGDYVVQPLTFTGYYPDGSVAWTETEYFQQIDSDSYLLEEGGGYLLQEDFFKIKL